MPRKVRAGKPLPGAESLATADVAERPRRRPHRSAVLPEPASAAEVRPAEAEKVSSRTWKQDLADVQRAGFWLWLCVLWLPSLTLSALSGPQVPQVLWKAAQSGSMGPAEASAIWQVLVLTAPFTLSVAIVGVALLRGWFNGDDWFQAAYFATFVLLAATLLAKALSIGASVEIEEVSPLRWVPICWGIDLAYSYAKVYTPWMFFASTTIGGFLAWAWSRKVMPHLQRA